MKHTLDHINSQALSVPGMDRRCLKADCGKCFGFCCTALYFSASEGFPVNKEAGKPCPNLQPDFSCRVHESLREMGLKGCTAYECFGAGQKVAQVTYRGHDWRQFPESAKQMFEAFLVMHQLHEMLWYLAEAFTLESACSIRGELSALINETVRLTLLSPGTLIGLDVASHRANVNTLIRKTSELVRACVYNGTKTPFKRRKTLGRGLDLIGADLRGTSLRGEDLRGAYLIGADLREADLSGADLIGADLRDADIRGANLSDSIFLTQAQVNAAKGDSDTKLPAHLTPPAYWLNSQDIQFEDSNIYIDN